MTQFIRWYDQALAPGVHHDIMCRSGADPGRIVGKVSGNLGAEADLMARQTSEPVLPDQGSSDIEQALPKYVCTTFIHPRF